ncbi:MAG TPA: ABC transporter ATP-binding protein [Myxococcota bacterium]|nr:ABC transporter ATP-binding protein [Myxococcota bacterium]
MKDALVVRGLVRTFGDVRAVDGLDLVLPRGRVLALVGPNGAGKTTAMRCIAGVVPSTEGQVEIGGVDLSADPIGARRGLAWVPHNPQLFDALSAWEHLAFAAAIWGTEGWEERGHALLARFEMAERTHDAVQGFSTGMRQKVALAAAAVHRPDLYLLDEPMNGLDPHAVREMRRWIREEAERGASFVLSSHLLALLDGVCTDVLVLVRGRPGFTGTIEEAKERFAGQDLEAVFFSATERA